MLPLISCKSSYDLRLTLSYFSVQAPPTCQSQATQQPHRYRMSHEPAAAIQLASINKTVRATWLNLRPDDKKRQGSGWPKAGYHIYSNRLQASLTTYLKSPAHTQPWQHLYGGQPSLREQGVCCC